MTLEQLKNEVTLLGFDDTVDTDAHILTSANRALRHIFNQRIITKTTRLFARRAAMSYYKSSLHCSNGKSTTLPANGKAYSMRLCGSGKYTITDGSVVTVKQFESGAESILVRGFLTWGGTIEFWGGFSFTVYDYSIYSEIFSNLSKDIPEGGNIIVFNLREMYGDFMAFISPATDNFGNPIPDCILRNGCVELGGSYKGEFLLTYRRLPSVIVEDTKQIDIPNEYLHLFPLLVASYVWLDTDPDKAAYYKERYDEMMSLIRSENYQSIDTKYKCEDGWA